MQVTALRCIRRTCVTVCWLRSVTKVTASAIEKKYVDGMRAAGKPSDAEQRRGIAEKAMTGACAGFDNYASTGEKGKRTFADFNNEANDFLKLPIGLPSGPANT